VEPGAQWADVITEAQVFGLAGLMGSSSVVGVVGYTLGGGFGWLGRKYGFNADGVREADVVMADGEMLRVSAYEHPDLFWGLKGGGGNFGIVTSMEFALHPLTTVYGGNLFYSLERITDVLDLYSRWAETLPDEMRPYETGATYVNFLGLGDWNPERTRASYSSEDWERLVELKDRYDPDNLFRFNRNIPSSSVAY